MWTGRDAVRTGARHHRPLNEEREIKEGWLPTLCLRRGERAAKFTFLTGGIAQLVERLVRNEKVRGSNPLASTV